MILLDIGTFITFKVILILISNVIIMIYIIVIMPIMVII